MLHCMTRGVFVIAFVTARVQPLLYAGAAATVLPIIPRYQSQKTGGDRAIVASIKQVKNSSSLGRGEIHRHG